MAERYAVQTGNWSDTATWNGGTLPTSSDDVYANGFTVTIDQDITVLSLRTGAGTTAVAGGGFTFSTVRTINADIRAGTSICLTCTLGTVTNINTINGNIFGGTGGSGNPGFRQQGSSTTNVIGNVTGGTGGNTNYGIWNSGSGVVNITGAVTGGGGANNYGAYNQGASGIINIVGDVTGGTNATAYGVFNNQGSTIDITGNATSATARALFNNGTGSINLTGNVTASATASGLSNGNANGTVAIKGSLISSSTGFAYAGGMFLITPSNPQTMVLYGNTAGSASPSRTFYTKEGYPS